MENFTINQTFLTKLDDLNIFISEAWIDAKGKLAAILDF